MRTGVCVSFTATSASSQQHVDAAAGSSAEAAGISVTSCRVVRVVFIRRLFKFLCTGVCVSFTATSASSQQHVDAAAGSSAEAAGISVASCRFARVVFIRSLFIFLFTGVCVSFTAASASQHADANAGSSAEAAVRSVTSCRFARVVFIRRLLIFMFTQVGVRVFLSCAVSRP